MTVQGTRSDPFRSLNDALENPRLRPIQIIYLLDGTHPIPATATLSKAEVAVVPFADPLAVTIDLTGAQVADGNGDAATAQNHLYLDGARQRIEDCIILSRPMTRTTPTRFVYPPAPPHRGARRPTIRATCTYPVV